MELAEVEFVFPAGDDERGDAVADEVGEGTGLGHEAVDAEDEGESGDGDGGDDGEGGGEGDESGAGDSGGAFGGEHRHGEQGEFLLKGEGDVESLRDKERGHGEIDIGPVQIEGVAGGNHQTDDGAGASEVLKFAHEGHEGGFGGGGSEDGEQFLAQVSQKAPETETGGFGDGPEDSKNEERAGEVKAAHEGCQGAEGGQSILADGEGHGGSGTHGSEFHNDVHHREHDVGGFFEEGVDRATLRAELIHGAAEEDSQEEDLEQVTRACEGVAEGLGDQMEEELGEGLVSGGLGKRGDGLGVERGGIDVEAFAGTDAVHDGKSQGEGEGGDDFEVEEGFEADAADLAKVAGVRDSQHYGAKHDGANEHFNQGDEGIAEGFQRDAPRGLQPAEGAAEEDGQQNPKIERGGTSHGVSGYGSSAGVEVDCFRSKRNGAQPERDRASAPAIER